LSWVKGNQAWLAFGSVGYVTEDGMIFTKRLQSQDHVREFVVDDGDERGWEVREEEDHRVVKQTWLTDWHRVENAMMRFGLQATQLQRAGWVDVGTP
jgi:hypothetical protein